MKKSTKKTEGKKTSKSQKKVTGNDLKAVVGGVNIFQGTTGGINLSAVIIAG